ncbi:AI-2E family transporter [Saccharibacillus sp. CPCC 101409]|uniref:AI-2E family transporter n=1 Tax=Saccharibacillus sp. CPCC 101409 TaxID=3058041 RepID=UPI002672EB55|nr:AI-2E family transporter [Saccharibacillus sp. CPCC 101409]MDO3410601.1 AI-2E family transporter [Saccharibacillus sp. CPCC 101409]
MFQKDKFARTCIHIVLVLLILFLLSKLQFVLAPLKAAFSLIFFPIALALFLYYLFRPVIRRLDKWKIRRPWSILLLYAVAVGVIVGFSLWVWPILRNQFIGFTNNLPQLAQNFSNQLQLLLLRLQEQEVWGTRINDIDVGLNIPQQLSGYLENVINSVSNYLSSALSVVAWIFLVVSTVPMILYFMLKDDRRGYAFLLKGVPYRYRPVMRGMAVDIDTALSGFIVGRVLLAACVGVFDLIGFLIVGVPYPLLLVLFIIFTDMIPYIGVYLGALPVVIVGFIDSPASVIWIIVVIVLGQMLRNNLLSPVIYGSALDIHPLTTVFLLLGSGVIGGFLAILIIIPVYMVVKIVVVHLYRYYRSRKLAAPKPL